ncbi:MAG: hypothetical protein ACK4UL_11290 [Novosphingobium meiothermophilum]|nr:MULTISPECIES: hypothetical protein [Novosphingobium]
MPGASNPTPPLSAFDLGGDLVYGSGHNGAGSGRVVSGGPPFSLRWS